MTDSKITVYTSDNFHESKEIMHFLDELSVEYEEKNISHDRTHLRELQEQNVYSAPAVLINDKIILGFQKDKIRRLLRIE